MERRHRPRFSRGVVTMVLSLEQQHAQEMAELASRQREAREEVERAARERRDAELDAAEAARTKARQEQEAADLEARIRTNFFANNPGATPEQYAKVKDRLIEEHQIAMARTDP